MSVGELSVGEMSVGELSVGEMSWIPPIGEHLKDMLLFHVGLDIQV